MEAEEKETAKNSDWKQVSFKEIVKDWEACGAAVHGVAKSPQDLEVE